MIISSTKYRKWYNMHKCKGAEYLQMKLLNL